MARKKTTRAIDLRVLARSQMHENRWMWIKPGTVSEYIPVIRYEDGPYLTIKL